MLNFLRKQVWSHLPTEVRPKDRLMAFLLWGIVLPLVLSGIYWIRHRSEPNPFGPVPGLMIGFGVFGLLVLIPKLGDHIYLNVLRFFAVFGYIVGRVGLTLAFYLVVTPIGVAMRLGGKDFLEKKKGEAPRWHDQPSEYDPKRYYRLF